MIIKSYVVLTLKCDWQDFSVVCDTMGIISIYKIWVLKKASTQWTISCKYSKIYENCENCI